MVLATRAEQAVSAWFDFVESVVAWRWFGHILAVLIVGGGVVISAVVFAFPSPWYLPFWCAGVVVAALLVSWGMEARKLAEEGKTLPLRRRVAYSLTTLVMACAFFYVVLYLFAAVRST